MDVESTSSELDMDVRALSWPYDDEPAEGLVRAVATGRSRCLIRASTLLAVGGDLQAVVEQIQTEWGEPQQQVGYSVPACPFVSLMQKHDALWITSLPAPRSAEELLPAVAGLLAAFPDLPPLMGPAAAVKSAVVVLRGCSRGTGSDLIAAVYPELKTLAVASGLMLGEFYRASTEPGTTLPRLRTKRGVAEYLAVRSMVRSDIKYLSGNPVWEAAYQRRFPGNGKAR